MVPHTQGDLLVAADASSSGRVSVWDTTSWARMQTVLVSYAQRLPERAAVGRHSAELAALEGAW
jgi:hypothetical protein